MKTHLIGSPTNMFLCGRNYYQSKAPRVDDRKQVTCKVCKKASKSKNARWGR